MSEHPLSPGSSGIGIDADELIAALRDPDPFVRVEALGRTDLSEGAVDVVAVALEDDYPLVRREAVRSLSRIGGQSAARSLVGVAAHDVSAEVREEAVAGLAGMLRARDASGAEG
jgi:HEAT repeat protein